MEVAAGHGVDGLDPLIHAGSWELTVIKRAMRNRCGTPTAWGIRTARRLTSDAAWGMRSTPMESRRVVPTEPAKTGRSRPRNAGDGHRDPHQTRQAMGNRELLDTELAAGC